MLTKKLDRTIVKIGLLYSAEKTENGYSLQMLIRSKLHSFRPLLFIQEARIRPYLKNGSIMKKFKEKALAKRPAAK